MSECVLGMVQFSPGTELLDADGAASVLVKVVPQLFELMRVPSPNDVHPP